MDKKIYIGVCYYPEQWPIERIEIDAELMKEAGINVVRMADLCWSTMEPQDGIFDFGIIDMALDALAKRDIQAVLCTPTMVPPMWMWKKHPDIFMTSEHYKANELRSRYCSNNSNYIEYTKRFVKRIALHYKDHPSVICWQIDNEFNAKPCICQDCSNAFRKWLMAKYCSLANLNQEWGTTFWSQSYTSWDQVAPPSKTEMIYSVSQQLDFLRFTSDSTVSFQKLQIEILRDVCPHHLLTHNGMGIYDRVDYFKLGEELDFYSFDSYPAVDGDNRDLCIAHDLSRGIKRKNYWVMEQKNGYFNYSPCNPAIEPGLVRLWSYRDLARGADGVVYFRWRSGRYGKEQHPQGLLRHDGSKRRAYHEVKQLTAELAQISCNLAGSVLKNDVAMLWSYDQIWAFETHVQNEKFTYVGLFKEYYNALAALGVNVDIVSSVVDLSAYKVVIAPALFLLNTEIADNLKSFVYGGGILVLTVRSGVKSWNNVTVDIPWPGLLYEMTGAKILEFDSLPQGVANTIEYKGKKYSVGCFLEILETQTASTVAIYKGKFYMDQPAVTANQYGRGTVFYCGVMNCPEFFKDIIRDILNSSGVKICTWPEGIEVTIRQSVDKCYTFVLNGSFEDRVVQLDREYTDLITGTRVTGDIKLGKLDVMILMD